MDAYQAAVDRAAYRYLTEGPSRPGWRTITWSAYRQTPQAKAHRARLMTSVSDVTLLMAAKMQARPRFV